jgi:hypothetical protein
MKTKTIRSMVKIEVKYAHDICRFYYMFTTFTR